MAEKTDSKPVQCRFKSDQGYMIEKVITEGGPNGVPQRRNQRDSEFSTGLPVGNKGPKGGKGKSKTPTQPKKVTPKKK